MNSWWKKWLTSPLINHFGKLKERQSFIKAPVLIGGCARTGTSLLLSILSAHAHIHCFAHEVDAFTDWITVNGQAVPNRIDRLYRALLLDQLKPTSTRWCEKRPTNCHFVRQIIGFYGPDVRVILMVRDPRAVCTSIHPEDPDSYWVAINRWVEDTSACLAVKDLPQVKLLKYEELITNQSAIKDVCEFLGEPMTNEIENWFDHAMVRKNRAWFESLQTIQTESLMKWTDAVHQKRVHEIISDQRVKELSARLGYEMA
jgi:hypothetical protein